MSICVLDSSSALAFVLPDESGHESDRLLDAVLHGGAVVTSLWSLETGHVLLRSERRRRITPDDRREAMNLLRSLPVQVDAHTASFAWTDRLKLAELHDLSLYDASYLETAIRLRLPLATRDKSLALAARERGVTILD